MKKVILNLLPRWQEALFYQITGGQNMGIKWHDVKIGSSILTNNIYIGKVRRDKSGMQIFTDKSGDKTKECVKAVMEHMLGLCEKDNLQSITFTIDGVCKLTLENLKEPQK